jgi:hypothetical protein
MDLLERLGDVLLYLGGGVFFTGAIPVMLRRWQARQGWVPVRVTVSAIDPDGRWVCTFPTATGVQTVRVKEFGDEGASVGNQLELHHPPGRPEAATNGSAFGYLAAAGLCALLALTCWAALFGAI